MVEEIAHELAGWTVCTKADALKAFLQIHLMKEASLLMMFNLHRGRLHILFMPFGAIMSTCSRCGWMSYWAVSRSDRSPWWCSDLWSGQWRLCYQSDQPLECISEGRSSTKQQQSGNLKRESYILWSWVQHWWHASRPKEGTGNYANDTTDRQAATAVIPWYGKLYGGSSPISHITWSHSE